MIGRMLLCLFVLATGTALAQPSETPLFDPEVDLISLHYDHAPDRDDGQSAAADRMVLETLFGRAWIAGHVVAVSGAYGLNAAHFDPASDAVMDAAFGDLGGWLSAHEDRAEAVEELIDSWLSTLRAGGAVWVKEGGQSDLTADVVGMLRRVAADLALPDRIHVVQHSDWNERQTSPAALADAREWTDYIRIDDANAYLNREGGDAAFIAAAKAHPTFGPIWKAAFAYYDPTVRLDFSDTGELFHLLGLGRPSFDEIRERFLTVEAE